MIFVRVGTFDDPNLANPAVTIARSLSDTFAGIRPGDVPWFVAAQFAGGLGATVLFRWLAPVLRSENVATDQDAARGA